MARYICTADCFDCRGVRRTPGEIVDYDADERVSKWFDPVATDGSAVEKVAAQVRHEAPNTLSELQKTLAEPEPFMAQAQAEPKPQEPSVPETKAPAKEPTKAPKARTRKKTTKK